MSKKSPIDLSRIPAPNVVEPLNYEIIFNGMRNDLLSLDPSLENVLQLESEPLVKQLQMCAYRELLLRQRVNEAARAVMLAYALDDDLENLGALFGVQRLETNPGDATANPPVPATYESDDDYRVRIQLALDGFSTAGPERAYVYHALSADGRVLDASAEAPQFSLAAIDAVLAAQLPANIIFLQVDYSAGLENPMPGDVVITVLSRDGDGTAAPELIQTVDKALSDDDIRPMTDHVHVRGADIINYSVVADLYTYAGPDSDVVLIEAERKLQQYVAEARRLGRSVTLSGIYASLHVAGVQRAVIFHPTADINCTLAQAAHCTNISLNHAGIAS